MDFEAPPKPLVSTRADDPEVEERIEAFVVGLGETVDALQDAQSGEDWELLAQRAGTLAAKARELGYPPVAAAADRVLTAASTRDPEAAHKAVIEVTELAGRVRRGHRSAA